MTDAKMTQFIAEWQPKIDAQLEHDLSASTTDADFAAMLRYAVLNGGKRLRPLMTLAMLTSCGQTVTPEQLRLATAVEWLHSYSLVHDDLPALDNDLLRRGQPSVHALFGEANAILVGDALLTGAFAVLSQPVPKASLLQSAQCLTLVQRLATLGGADGMIMGQYHDINNTDDIADVSTILATVHGPKTAALLSYASLAGATMAGAQMLIPLAEKFGYLFGISFQIKDDLDDITETADADLQTIPALIGVPESQVLLARYLSDARQVLADMQACDSTFDARLLTAFLTIIEGE